MAENWTRRYRFGGEPEPEEIMAGLNNVLENLQDQAALNAEGPGHIQI